MSTEKRERRRKRERRLVLALAAASLILAAGYVRWTVIPAVARQGRRMAAVRRAAATAPAAESPPPATPSRPLYPYSVIRGGAYSGAELTRALARDEAAARHYAVFRQQLVSTTASPFSEPVYLSYRVGDEIYWMSRPVRLPPGETLLTDGKNYARARCGNRISEKPQQPVSNTEPEPPMLDTPQPQPGSIRGVEKWSQNQLPVSPARGAPVSAVPDTLGGENGLSWWISSSGGFLSLGGGISSLLSLPLRTTCPPVPTIEPNPAPGVALPPSPGGLLPLLTSPLYDVGVTSYLTPPGAGEESTKTLLLVNTGGPCFVEIPGGGVGTVLPLTFEYPTYSKPPRVEPIPEPGMLPAVALAILAAAWFRRRESNSPQRHRGTESTKSKSKLERTEGTEITEA